MASRNQYTYTPGYQNGGGQPQQRGAIGYQAPRSGTARRPAAQAKRPAGDTVILSLLFIVAPLCGILGVFVEVFLWVFIGVTLLVLAAMWALRCFAPRGRAFLSGILAVLVVVALVSTLSTSANPGYFQTYGSDPSLTGGQTDYTGTQGNQPNSNNLGYAGLGASPTATAPIGVSQEGTGEEGLIQPIGADTQGTGTDGLAATQGESRTITSAAQQVMEKYMEMWQAQNFEDMVQYTLPEWQSAQSMPQRQLNWAHGGWLLEDWDIIPEAQSPTADSVTLKIVAQLTKNVNTKTPVTNEYSALVINRNGTWFVDPDTMRNGVKVEETKAPNAAMDENGASATAAPSPTTDPSLKLWYNSDDGKMYHLKEKCSSINERNYKYMKSFKFSQLDESPYNKLKPCSECSAPKRP